MERKSVIKVAVSISAIFWSVAWSSLIREIIDGGSATLNYAFLPALDKKDVITTIVLFLGIFSLVLIRWFGRLENWPTEVGLVETIKKSVSLIAVTVAMILALTAVVSGLGINTLWAHYSTFAIIIWPVVPFASFLFYAIFPN